MSVKRLVYINAAKNSLCGLEAEEDQESTQNQDYREDYGHDLVSQRLTIRQISLSYTQICVR